MPRTDGIDRHAGPCSAGVVPACRTGSGRDKAQSSGLLPAAAVLGAAESAVPIERLLRAGVTAAAASVRPSGGEDTDSRGVFSCASLWPMIVESATCNAVLPLLDSPVTGSAVFVDGTSPWSRCGAPRPSGFRRGAGPAVGGTATDGAAGGSAGVLAADDASGGLVASGASGLGATRGACRGDSVSRSGVSPLRGVSAGPDWAGPAAIDAGVRLLSDEAGRSGPGEETSVPDDAPPASADGSLGF